MKVTSGLRMRGLRSGLGLVIAMMAILLVGVTGCARQKVVYRSDTSINTPLNTPLTHSSLATIEIINYNQTQIPYQALRSACERFVKLIPGRVKFNLQQPRSLAFDAWGNVDRNMLEKDFNSISKDGEHPGPATIYVLTVPSFEGERGLGMSRPIVVDRGEKGKTGSNMVVLFERNIKHYGKNIGYLNETGAWEYALYKELCRTLGLPHRSGHIFKGGQCTNPECLMYPTFIEVPGKYGVKASRPSMRLCDACSAEAFFAGQRTMPNPLLDPDRMIEPADWYNRLVEANPLNPDAHLTRYDQRLKSKDFVGAKEDLKAAFDNCNGDAGISNMYARFLASCEAAELRDGKKAMDIALHLNQVTNFKDADFVETLAMAYEEMGNVQKAIEYYQKATDIMTEVHVEKERGPAFFNPNRRK